MWEYRFIANAFSHLKCCSYTHSSLIKKKCLRQCLCAFVSSQRNSQVSSGRALHFFHHHHHHCALFLFLSLSYLCSNVAVITGLFDADQLVHSINFDGISMRSIVWHFSTKYSLIFRLLKIVVSLFLCSEKCYSKFVRYVYRESHTIKHEWRMIKQNETKAREFVRYIDC